MRHGDVSYFDEQGRPVRPDTVALNEEGIRQAAAAADALRAVCFDRVLSSDLPRSMETARIVSNGRELALETRSELREIQPGRLADIPAGSIESAFLKAFSFEITRDTRFLGGETIGALVDRVGAFFQSLLKELNWQHLLIVAHGGVNRALLGHALGLDLRAFSAMEQDPACINIVDVEASGNSLLRLLNYTPYNAAKIGSTLSTMEGYYLQFRKYHP
jgi:probable phosphoglycerate mutase